MYEKVADVRGIARCLKRGLTNIVYGCNVLYPPVNPFVYDPSVATTYWRTNTLNYAHNEMTPIMGVVESISPPMCGSH